MRQEPLTNVKFTGVDNGVANFSADGGFAIALSCVDDGILHLTISSESHPVAPHDNIITSAEKPLTLSSVDSEGWTFIAPGGIKIVATHEDGPIAFAIYNSAGQLVHEDLPSRSYGVDGRGFVHYTRMNKSALHLGLGEKAAPMDLSGRDFVFGGRDAIEYDSYEADPLYKINPLLIVTPKNHQENWAFAEFNPSNQGGGWNIGREFDGYWGHMKHMYLDQGGLEKYFIISGTRSGLNEIVQKYSTLVGKPMLVSRHWLGYLASSMAYAESDDPPAQQVMLDFPQKCAKHDIPCSVMHLSSGYTVTQADPPRRNVFNLNTHRYPDFEGMCDEYHQQGMLLSANIKPYVSTEHPDFDMLNKAGALFTDHRTNGSVITKVWCTVLPFDKSQGSWVDMTHPEGFKWWQKNVEQLMRKGIDSAWNDNNEYSLHHDKFRLHNHGQPTEIGLAGRMANTQQMAKASFDASRVVFPKRRPMILSRSANVGTLRYVATCWSGDNYTSWKNMKGNTIMGLNAGLALLQSYGHDVGGFSGPVPNPEQFLRWVQVGIYNPRFCIHSASMDGKDWDQATEPWMYPEILPSIRKLIKRRYELIPYLYELSWRSHLSAEPPNKWIGYGEYETDENVYKHVDGADFWLGDALLIAGVFEPNTKERVVYLPTNGKHDDGYYYLNDFSIHDCGSSANVNVEDNIAVFAKVGSAIPVGKNRVTVTKEGERLLGTKHVEYDDWRGVEIYPHRHGCNETHVYEWREDDGESLDPSPSTFRITYSSTRDTITVKVSHISGDYKPMWGDKVDIILPGNDTRTVQGGERTDSKRPTFTINLS